MDSLWKIIETFLSFKVAEMVFNGIFGVIIIIIAIVVSIKYFRER